MKSIFQIDVRKKIILKAVVVDYVQTAEPVGSHILAARHQFGVKSATIRNELAELAELGYLFQPHTSAGRIPSDMGYRCYVDCLMDAATSPSADKEELVPRRTEIDLIIEQTCRVLSRLAHYTSVATHPNVKSAVITMVSVASVGNKRLLVVLVMDNGQVIHEMLEFDASSKNLDSVRAGNFLMHVLGGKSLESVGSIPMATVPDDSADMKELLGKVVGFIKREVETVEESDIHLEGASYIMQQPEFREAGRLEAVLSVLEQRSALYKLLSSIYLGPEVSIIIGSENPVDEMRDCSFVGAKYLINGRVAGTIGVVGPTRMDYRRAVGAVEFMSRNLGEMLSDLCVA